MYSPVKSYTVSWIRVLVWLITHCFAPIEDTVICEDIQCLYTKQKFKGLHTPGNFLNILWRNTSWDAQCVELLCAKSMRGRDAGLDAFRHRIASCRVSAYGNIVQASKGFWRVAGTWDGRSCGGRKSLRTYCFKTSHNKKCRDDFDLIFYGYSRVLLSYRVITEQSYMRGNIPIDDCLKFVVVMDDFCTITLHTQLYLCAYRINDDTHFLNYISRIVDLLTIK